MARKQRPSPNRNTSTPSQSASDSLIARETPQSFFLAQWPETFSPPRVTTFMVAASLVLGVMVFVTASLDGFTALKIGLAQHLGLTMPELVSTANFDVAFVIWGLGTVVLMGLIHPCLGLCMLVLARAWLDGYTFPGDNIYFTWSIYLLLALWLVKPLRRRAPIRTPMPATLYGAFILMIFITTRYTSQYYTTYQLLWLWIGYGALFLLIVNAVRDTAAFNLSLTVFLFAMGLQAVFSILHFEYLLPFLREVIKDPAVLRSFFNTNVITPELARRFMVNRAFGSMLFPNALAAYLLLGIPFACVMTVPYWRDLQTALKGIPKKNVQPEEVRERMLVLSLSIFTGVLSFIAVFFVAHFPKEYRQANQPLPVYLDTAPLAVMAFLVAAGAGLACCLLLLRLGLFRCWLLLRFFGTAILAPLLVYTLWITYSRGAYLALIATSVWGVVLYYVQDRHWRLLRDKLFLTHSFGVLIVIVLLACGVLIISMVAASNDAWAQFQEAPPSDPRTHVSQEGLTLTMSDLADPASFRLRLGYWRVAWRMAVGNLLTGVGLGNFAIAYPAYQYVGAGDVREAHNGYLQMFAETGLAGGVLFAAFWICIGLWGADRIVREQNKREKLLLLGIYCGIVAFCAHAFLDINFSHPSLMLFAVTAAGLFYTRANTCHDVQKAETEIYVKQGPKKPSYGHAVAAAILLLLLLVFGAAAGRVYSQQLALNRYGFINVSNDNELNRRMRTGRFFLMDLSQAGFTLMKGEKLARSPQIPVSLVRLFFDDFTKLETLCTFYKPSQEVARRFLLREPGEPIHPEGLMVVRRPFLTRRLALERIAYWLEELETLDRRFPFSPELALHIATWYEMHVHHIINFDGDVHRPGWVANFLKWAEIMTLRNPTHADMRMYYARALLWPALHEPFEGAQRDQDEYIGKSVAQWEHMLALAPISPGHRYHYIAALELIANHYSEHGDEDSAKHHRERAAELRTEAVELQRKRQEAQLYP